MLDWLIRMLRATWADPAPTFRQILQLGIAPQAVWQMAVLICALLVGVNYLPGPPPADLAPEGLPAPFLQFALQLLFLVIPAGLIQAIGRHFGRESRLTDCLLAICWAQIAVMPLQLLLALTLYRAPGLAGLFMLGLIAATLWFLTVFITELHGYTSRGRVLLSIVGAMLTLGALAAALVPPGMI